MTVTTLLNKIYCTNNNNNNNLFNWVATDQIMDLDSVTEVTVGHERQCTSLCYYNKRCVAYSISEIEPRQIECRIFDTTYDFYKNRLMKNLIQKSSTKLYSKYFPKRDCVDWYKSGARENGVFQVQIIPQITPRMVFCYMEAHGGGWMAFSKRFNGSVQFHERNWDHYKNGFGTAEGEYWLGNEYLHQATKSTRRYDLLIIATSVDGVVKISRLKNFIISSENNQYEMNNDGNAAGFDEESDRFLTRRPNKFSSLDRDNDKSDEKNCADNYKSGWWYGSCSNSQMNGIHLNSKPKNGIYWSKFKNNDNETAIIEKLLLLIKPISE